VANPFARLSLKSLFGDRGLRSRERSRTTSKRRSAPPFARKVLFQELEQRVLLSADVSPWTVDPTAAGSASDAGVQTVAAAEVLVIGAAAPAQITVDMGALSAQTSADLAASAELIGSGSDGFEPIVSLGNPADSPDAQMDSAAGLDVGPMALSGSGIEFGALAATVTGTADNLTVTGTTGADVIRLRAGPAAGQLTFSSDNGSFANLTIAAPNGSLTVNAGSGDDIIIVDDLGPGFVPGLVGSGAPQLLLSFGLGNDTLSVGRGGAGQATLTNTSVTLGTQVVQLTDVPEQAAVAAASLNAATFSGATALVQGVPTWISQGPGPLNDGQVTGIVGRPVTGAIQAIAVPDNNNILVGTVGGGVWRISRALESTINFATAESTLDAADTAALTTFAASLAGRPGVTIELGGHTDSTGTDASNIILSRQRAESAKALLVSLGIAPERIAVIAYGESVPIGDNATLAGQAQNRRVEVNTYSAAPLTDHMPSLSITALAVDPSNPNIIYAGTGSASSSSFSGRAAVAMGVLKSTDGGQTWTLVGRSQFLGSTIKAVEVTAGGVLMVTTDGTGVGGGGLFRSTNGGASFSDLRFDSLGKLTDTIDNDGDGTVDEADEAFPAGAVTDLILDPVNLLRMFAGVAGKGVYISDDAGQSWSPVNNNISRLATASRVQLAISATADASTGNRPVYAAVIGSISDQTTLPIAVGANSFRVAAGTLLQAGDTVRISDGVNPDQLFTINSITNQADGSRQVNVGGQITARAAGATLAVGGQRLSGVFRSADNGATWTAMALPGTVESTGFFGIHVGRQGTNHFSMVADPANAQVVYIGGDRQPGGGGGEPNFPNTLGASNFTGRLFRGDASKSLATQWLAITDNKTADPDGAGPLVGSAPHADSRAMVFVGGHILESDDGGLYRLLNPGQPDQSWQSLNAGLSLTEFYSVAYDTVNNRIIGGTQDIGVAVQPTSGSAAWSTVRQGDGAYVQTAGATVYYSSQKFGSFAFAAPLAAPVAVNASSFLVPAGTPMQVGDRVTLPNEQFRYLISAVTPVGGNLRISIGTNQLGSAYAAGTLAEVRPQLRVAGTNGGNLFNDLAGTVFDPTVQFVQPFAVNQVNPNALLVGTNWIYESVDNGRNLTLLNGNPVAVPPTPNNFQPPQAANVGQVKALLYGGRQPDGLGGFQNHADFILVGTNPAASPAPIAANAHGLWIRQPGAGVNAPLRAVTSFTNAAGAAVVAVAANPDDWRQIYALDAQGRVWFSGDGAQADLGTWNWSQLTANLLALPGAKTLQRIAVEQVGATRVVVVGGEGGVFRRVANGNWVEYGAGIPNAMVTTVDRITGADDVALVGTLGRGAWVLPNASQTLSQPAVLTLRGTGGNDVIQLERNAAQPALLDVFQYLDGQAKPANASLSVPLASIESIVVDGLGGNDRIVVDTVRGAIGVAGGITVAGGLGTDQIELRRTPAAGSWSPTTTASSPAQPPARGRTRSPSSTPWASRACSRSAGPASKPRPRQSPSPRPSRRSQRVCMTWRRRCRTGSDKCSVVSTSPVWTASRWPGH
jgi:outer membrane protein OmpA-like peptidoglycan-associated protein